MAELTLKRIQAQLGGAIHAMNVPVPDAYYDLVKHLVEDEKRRQGPRPYFTIRIKGWRPRRSQGPGSQNNHLHGHIHQICAETGGEFESVKLGIKHRAAQQMAYPFEKVEWKDAAGNVYASKDPLPSAKATTQEFSILIECAHLVAAELGIILREEDDW